MKLLSKKEGAGEGKLDDHHSREKEEMCFTNSSEGLCVSGAVAGQEKIARIHKSASYVRKEPKAYAAKVEAECATNRGPLRCHSEHVSGRENHQKHGSKRMPVSGNLKLAENSKPELSCQKNGTPITIHLSNYTLSSQQCSSDIAPLNLQNESKLISPVALQSQDAGRNDNREANYRSVWSQKWKEHERNDRYQEKGKEKILQYGEDCGNTSKNSEDSIESVESSNSQKLVLGAKRPWSFDPNYLGCKKLKKECNGSSGSQIRKDSSFINWMSSMTKNLSIFYHTKPSTSLFPQFSNMNEKLDSFPKTANNGGSFFQSRGFTSMFQGLTRPSTILQNIVHVHDHQKVAINSEGLKVDHVVSGDQDINLNSLHFSIGQTERSSNGAIRIGGLTKCRELQSEELNQGNYQVQEHPLASLDMLSNPSAVYRKMGHKIWKFGVRKIIKSPSCSTKNHHTCAEENVNQTTCIPNKYIHCELNGRSDLFENLWVARFLRKKSSSNLNSDGFGVNLEIVSPDNENCLADNSWRAKGIYDRYHQKAERSIMSEQLKWFQNPHSNSCSFRSAEDKIRSNVNPLLPSQMFKKSEPLASLFAKRLDALRHILSSKISDTLSHTATTCLFCGKSDHNIRNCVALAESDKSFLPVVESYDDNDTSSRFCIRCFQFNHWAIACPGAVSKVESSYNLFMPGNMRFGTTEEKVNIDKSCHHDGRIFLQNNRRGNLKDKALCAANTSSSEGKFASPSIEGKKRVSYFRENESKIIKALNPRKSMAIEVISGQNEILEAIKKLQLSRTDIMRWMKSSNSCLRLEGFFLRLRIGKWEQGRGGTGYHVARIKGVSCENSISVGSGYFTCSVDYRFVSNHDYTEDELKAWCAATLKYDCKLPSIEELDMKLRERTELGF